MICGKRTRNADCLLNYPIKKSASITANEFKKKSDLIMTIIRSCGRCGALASAGAKFCVRCGALIEPGLYNGRHYTEYVGEVQRLMREDKLDNAEKLLLELVNATENESQNDGCGVAPWYYERLAVLYRKKKDKESEIKILERYARQKHAPGATPPKLMARLTKLKS
jgi:hypothetical protein